MTVLLVGSGAREHALAWKLAQDTELVLLPGNAGMAHLGRTVEGVRPTDAGAVAVVADQLGVDLVVVGPEAPLAAGVADTIRARGIPVFGPSRAAARLESSKAFSKQVMSDAGVPTADARVFEGPGPALDHLRGSDGPYVVKADGLAAGKGVLVTEDRHEAEAWVERCFDGGFGEAGSRIVIEDFLDGPELSVFAICDGERFVTLDPARDYKRLADGDRGPNTGGMGSYSPVDLPAGLVARVGHEVIAPTLEAMRTRGNPYVGFLYVGLALTADGPRVIEFNCRLGDPETQVVLPRMAGPLLPLLESAAEGALEGSPEWDDSAAVNVVLASAGYPESPRKGDPIRGLDDVDPDILVFHAGTAIDGKRTVTAGGRVLSVVGRGPDLASARSRAYAAVDGIRFDGRLFRTDIAQADS